MKIQDLRLGNLIRINPRKDEEGILFLAEIHPLSIIGVMLYPRQGYHFRIKFDEMLPVDITEDWLQKLGFAKLENSDLWIDKRGLVQIKVTDDGGCFIFEGGVLGEKITHAHTLQNHYFFRTGEELAPKLSQQV